MKMKKMIAAGLFAICAAAVQTMLAEAVPQTSAADTVQVLADKTALKELVDNFSILADQKDGIAQIPLFTKDAVVENYMDGKLVQTIRGNEKIGKVFDDFLKTQDTVYHMNGQQVFKIDGDRAMGTCYCFVVLVYSDADGTKMKRMNGMRYEDEYAKEDGTWKIAKRKSFFTWADYAPLGLQP
jgi:hypothetical protein